jgi:ribosome-associated toxin RatA of RatAB toxin-antitoxin module
VQQSGVKPGRAIGVINAPASVVRDIIAGMDSYKDFVPRISGSRKVKNGAYVVESKMPWPVNETWVYVRVRAGERDGTLTIQWKMTNGSLKQYEGVAWIQPMDNGRSLLTYQMLAVPDTAAPDALISYGLREGAGSMIKAVRKRAAKVLAQQRQVPGRRVAEDKDR